MTRPIAVPLSLWIEAIRSDLHQALCATPDLSLTTDEVMKLTALLSEVAAEARLLERRAANAPPLEPLANVLPFVRPTKPTEGGDAA